MVAWLKLHWLQLLIVALSVTLIALQHFGVLKPEQVVFIGAALGAIGLHLPAIVYKLPPIVGAMLVGLLSAFALSLVMLACATVAKTQYGSQLDACIDQAHNRAEADSCIKRIQLEWDEAGAPPALVFTDGGAQ